MTGAQIKDKLIEAGYKLSDIAQSMGISPQSLHKFLLVEDIKTGVLERIAKAINQNISFFFEGGEKEEEIKLTNEIISKEKQLYFLYQRVVDVAILNKDYLKISNTLDTSRAAEIMNNHIFPDPTYEYKEDDKGERVLTITSNIHGWKDYNIDKKRWYNAELGESVRLVQEIFFDQFKLLYKEIRNMK